MVWPPQSPDLNPIEQFFDYIKSKLNRMDRSSEKAIWNSLQNAWNDVTVADLRKYINTMPDRCKAVIKAKGGHTKY